MKIITVIGARPQFIKAAVVSKAIINMAEHGAPVKEYILHTGQHYDYTMSEIFFTQLGIPTPKWHLNSRNNLEQMRDAITSILKAEQPDIVIVYGDTNSTLIGAQAAHSLQIPISHIEAGLRSFNNSMPEEYNRIEADKMATWLFCPTQTAVDNLKREGFSRNIYNVGDVMYDAALMFTPDETTQQKILNRYNLSSKQFALATLHRASTAENISAITSILQALAQLQMTVLLPLHPHTAKTIQTSPALQQLLKEKTSIQVIEPIGYIDFLALEHQAKLILTDSGGMQKEAYFQATPCITLRNETEWTETVSAGWNRLAGTNTQRILQAAAEPFSPRPIREYGDGHSAETIINILCQDAF